MADNKDKKVLNVPALRFPEFTGEWKEVPFSSNLERLENGANYDTNDKNGVPMSRIETISTGHIDYAKVGYCSAPQKIEHYMMQYGDILFSHINSLKHIGKTAYYSAEQPLYHGINLLLFRCNDNVDSKFFFFLLNNALFIRKCQILAKQAVNQASISTSDLRRIRVNIPNKNEQLKIQNFLSLIETRIELQNKIIEKLETLIKGIVDSIFTANKFPKVPFKEIYVRAGEGGTPATSIPEYYDNGTISFIKIDDLQNKYIESSKDCITELGLQKSSAWIVPSNSIIYSNGATIGAISINLFPVCTKQGILGVVPKANINVEFLYYFMTSIVFTKAVERIVTEGTMRTAYLKDINHIAEMKL